MENAEHIEVSSLLKINTQQETDDMNILYSAIKGIFGHPDPFGEQVGTKKDCEVNTWSPPNSSMTRKTRKLRNKAAKVARKRNRR